MILKNQTQIHQILIERQDAIAKAWQQAVPRLGFVPFSISEERQQFYDLTRQVIQCLGTEPFDHQAAQAIGTRLALLRRSQSEALGSTHMALPSLLTEGLTAEQAADLMPGLGMLFTGLLIGFFQQARDTILQEQESIRGALATVNARLIQDLHKELEERKRIEQELLDARQALELRVQERTAQLAQANLALQADIDERLRTEQELRLRDRTLTALLNAPVDINVVLDLDGVVQLANQNAATRLGITVEELTGKCIWDYYPPVMTDYRKKVMKEVIQSRQAQRLDVHGLAGDYDSLAYPILDDQGEVVKVAIMARDISDRLRAEENLRLSNQTLKVLLNNPIDLSVLLNTDGTVILANDTLAAVLGTTADEMTGKCLWDYFPPTATEFRKSVIEQVIQTGQAQRVDDRLGKTDAFDSLVLPIKNEAGDVVQVAILARNINDRLRTEQALKESEERYRSLVETSPDGIITTDLQGYIRTANQRFLQLFGASSLDDLKTFAANPLDLLIENDRPRAAENMQSVLAEGISIGVEHQAHRLDGTIFPIATSASTILDDDGQPNGFIVTVRDISRRKADEEALRKSEALLRSIVTNAPVVLAIVDPSGTISMVQSQESVTLGWDPKEFTGQNAFKAFPFNPGIIQDIKRALEGETVAAIIDTRNGLSYETRYSPIVNELGKISGVIIVGVNITERRQAQRQLQKAHDELEQRVAERTSELEYINRELLDEVALRAQAEERQRHSAERAEALARMARRINARLDLQAVLKAICEETSQLLHFPSNSVVLYDEDRDEFSVATSISPMSPRNFHVSGRIYEEFVRQRGPIIVIEDCQALPQASGFQIIAEMGLRTAVSAPLYYAGKLIGAINLISQKVERLPSEEDQILLQGLADQAAVAITNARLFEQVLREPPAAAYLFRSVWWKSRKRNAAS